MWLFVRLNEEWKKNKKNRWDKLDGINIKENIEDLALEQNFEHGDTKFLDPFPFW